MTATGQLTDAEKKAKKKAKKAAQKIQEDPRKAATSANEDKGLEAPAPKDDDPYGTKLLASPEGLETAARLLQPLVDLELPSLQLWVTVYDVSFRRSKLVIALPLSQLIFNCYREILTGGESPFACLHTRPWRSRTARPPDRDSQAL